MIIGSYQAPILESSLLDVYQIEVFHRLKVSYLCVCNGFSQIAIDVIRRGSCVLLETSWIVFPRK